MKLITKWFLTFAMLCIAGVVNAATEYEIDQKFTSVEALEGQLVCIINETDAKAIYNKDAQNLAYDTYSTAIAGTAYLWKFHSLANEADAEVQSGYTVEIVKADGSSIGLWGNPAIYLNSGAEGGFDGCFVLGLGDKYGTDVKYGGVWEIEYDADKGFALKNKARGGFRRCDSCSYWHRSYLLDFLHAEGEGIYRSPGSSEGCFECSPCKGQYVQCIGLHRCYIRQSDHRYFSW
jgi:hypothetical protein